MGDAKRRGTYEQRVRLAVLAGRARSGYVRPRPVPMPTLGQLFREATFARFPHLRPATVTARIKDALARWKARKAAVEVMRG